MSRFRASVRVDGRQAARDLRFLRMSAGMASAKPGFRRPGTLSPKPFEGSTKRPNLREAPLGVYLRAIARPVSESRLIRKRKARLPVRRSVPKPLAQPRVSAAEISRRAVARDKAAYRQVRDALRGAPPLEGKALRLWVQAKTVRLSLGAIQDQITASYRGGAA